MSAATDAGTAPLQKAPARMRGGHRLINASHVRQLLLDTAQTRAHRFTRVSDDTLSLIEGRVRSICADIVRNAPSKGVTL